MTAARRPNLRNRAVITGRRLVDLAPPRISHLLVDSIEARHGEPEMAFLPALVRAGEVAVDVGANRGVYTRLLARVSPRVIACEPQPRLATRLAVTAPANVTVLPVALSAGCGEATLHVPVVGSSPVHTRATLGDAGGEHVDVQVLRVRLDDLGLSSVGFIKVDVEGHELDVLSGGTETIERGRPRLLIECEAASGAHPAEVGSRLARLGYEGWFHYDGAVLPLAEFDAASHQAGRKAVGGRRPRSRATNFMFLPSREANAVLDAARAIARRC